MTKAVLLTDGQSYIRVLKRDDDAGFECVTDDGELVYRSEAGLAGWKPVLTDEIEKANARRIYYVVREDGMTDWYAGGRYLAPQKPRARYG